MRIVIISDVHANLAALKAVQESCRTWHAQILSAEEKAYLRGLPLSERLELGDASFFLAHASPAGDLYKYLRPDVSDEVLAEEIREVNADFIFIGHTHLPMLRHLGKTTIVNPGSVGQPRHGDPRVSYVVWEDGEVHFRRLPYDISKTITILGQAPLPSSVLAQLTDILRTGGAKGY